MSTISVSSSGVARLVERFIEEVRVDGGTEWMLRVGHVGEGMGGAAIRVEKLVRAPEFEALTSTAGVRADGNDPDCERYGLTVASDGIRIWAQTDEGIFRGLTTLRQLIRDGQADGARTVIEALRILDAPRLAWRGLSLDVARAFHPPAEVRRVIDMLALHKMNVLHLHLTDDQAWRMPVSGWPRLTDGYDSYSAEDISSLVDYARERFVTLVPEIDMPGHSAAAVAAYPELGATGLDNILNPDRDITWAFVRDVLTETRAAFPQSAFIHVGADEAFGMTDEAHARFVSGATSIVHELGVRAVGWQEAARGELSAGDIVQFWIEPALARLISADQRILASITADQRRALVQTFAKAEDDVPAARRRGARVIASPTSTMYLDAPYEEASTDGDDETARARLGMPLYPPVSVRTAYEADPFDAVAELELEDIAGIEGAIWCESVRDGADLEFLLMPRLAGIGEIGWSPRSAVSWTDYRRRLARVARIWRARGWRWFRSSLVDWSDA
jgi:hexosaminidase